MMSIRYSYYFFVVFAMLSCTNEIEQQLCRKWHIEDQGSLPRSTFTERPFDDWGYYDFKNDGIFIYKSPLGTKGKGRWHITGGDLKLILEGETKVLNIKEISENKLELTTKDFYISMKAFKE